MKVVLFGATGMVGQGVLRECLLDPRVERVLSIGRTRTGQSDSKLREIVHQNFLDFTPLERELGGYDACFFCLGITSAGMSEGAYRRIAYDFTLAAARSLVKVCPAITFIYVSGTGTDSTERKGDVGAGQGGDGERTADAWVSRGVAPLYPIVKALAPRYVTTTEAMGRAMINVAMKGWPNPVLESPDINAAAAPRTEVR